MAAKDKGKEDSKGKSYELRDLGHMTRLEVTRTARKIPGLHSILTLIANPH